MLLGTVVQFLVAHMGREARLDDLAASQSANRDLTDALSVCTQAPQSRAAWPPVLTARIRAAKMMEYELAVTPTVDPVEHLRLPLLLLARLLPAGGGALGCAALALQALQASGLDAQAGEVCAGLALAGVAAGFGLEFAAEAGPGRRRLARQRSLRLHRAQTGHLAEVISRESSASRARRRDALRAKLRWLTSRPEAAEAS